MNLIKALPLVLITLSLSACDDIRTKLHLMPNQDEQQCLDSERFNFKDPDVLFVANLGDRGLGVKKDKFWVRYKAKNSYGAYIQGNMACELLLNKWVRDGNAELSAVLDVQIYFLHNRKDGDRAADFERQAVELVLTSANDLGKYAQKK